MKDVKALVARAVEELESVGIEAGNIVKVSVNTRAVHRWGQCKRLAYGKGYEIEISSVLLADDVSDEATMDTVMHEVIHTCKGCMNHGANFKRVAHIVNVVFDYNVKRCTSAEEKNLTTEVIKTKYKYHVVCANCGAGAYFTRATKIVKALQTNSYATHYYQCKMCHSVGKFKLEVL